MAEPSQKNTLFQRLQNGRKKNRHIKEKYLQTVFPFHEDGNKFQHATWWPNTGFDKYRLKKCTFLETEKIKTKIFVTHCFLLS